MSYSILVVDDEQPIRSLLTMILQEGGYLICTAESVAEARALLSSAHFDLIITDLNMPGESGLELIRHVQEQQLDIAMVMATIMDNPIEASHILDAGVYGYMVKPFNRNLVLITVANALRRHQLERLEQASRRSLESKLNTIIENLHVGLLLLDRDLRVVESNRKLSRWFAAPPTDGFFLDGNCLHSEIDRRCSDCLCQALADSKPLQYKARIETIDGPRDFQLSILPVDGDSPEKRAVVLMMDDLTEQLGMERELRQAQKLEAIGQLAAGIAHEINTPMQYVGDNLRFISDSLKDLDPFFDGYAELEQKLAAMPGLDELSRQMADLAEQADLDYLREELPQTARQSLEGVARISSIIKAMKEFSHPGTTDKVPTDINQSLESTITVSRNEWKYVADLDTDFAPDLPAIPCITGELNQVFLNLIINAAHAIGSRVQQGHYSKGHIRIATRPTEKGIIISISDNGGGIPQEIQHRIFDPFFTTKGIGKGTGQGLSIARNIVMEKHGGNLYFSSEPGQGTTFSIFLPMKATEKEPAP